MTSTRVTTVLILLAAALLAGCAPAITIAPPKQVPVHVAVTAGPGVNPDRSGRASPVVLRIYQLSADGEFLAAEFFALYQNEAIALPHTLLAREERLIAPGESQSLELSVKPETRFVAVMAAFREVERSTWRAITPAHARSITVALSANAVVLTPTP